MSSHVLLLLLPLFLRRRSAVASHATTSLCCGNANFTVAPAFCFSLSWNHCCTSMCAEEKAGFNYCTPPSFVLSLLTPHFFIIIVFLKEMIATRLKRGVKRESLLGAPCVCSICVCFRCISLAICNLDLFLSFILSCLRCVPQTVPDESWWR